MYRSFAVRDPGFGIPGRSCPTGSTRSGGALEAANGIEVTRSAGERTVRFQVYTFSTRKVLRLVGHVLLIKVEGQSLRLQYCDEEPSLEQGRSALYSSGCRPEISVLCLRFDPAPNTRNPAWEHHHHTTIPQPDAQARRGRHVTPRSLSLRHSPNDEPCSQAARFGVHLALRRHPRASSRLLFAHFLSGTTCRSLSGQRHAPQGLSTLVVSQTNPGVTTGSSPECAFGSLKRAPCTNSVPRRPTLVLLTTSCNPTDSPLFIRDSCRKTP